MGVFGGKFFSVIYRISADSHRALLSVTRLTQVDGYSSLLLSEFRDLGQKSI